jgi:transposase InsO family protein
LAAPRSRNFSKTAEGIGGQGRAGKPDPYRRSGPRAGAGARRQGGHGEIETEHPGYLGAQDTYYVGTIKAIGRIYPQTFIDTYAKVAFAKLYDRKNALVAADMLNDRVLPFYEENDVALLRVLTDRGTEYCGNRESHEYQLYLAVENIDHSRTRAKSPQTNGICERFHRTVQEEFYSVAFRKKLYSSLDELQLDLDEWMREYNEQRAHSGKYCFGKTPLETFRDSAHLAQAKMIDRLAVTGRSDTGRQRAEPEPERSHAERSGGGGAARVNAA